MSSLGIAMEPVAEKRRFYVSGQPVELWEDSDNPFGWTRDDMEGYAAHGEWELLFNALVLNSAAETAAGSPAA
jgi:hypothetical protein